MLFGAALTKFSRYSTRARMLNWTSLPPSMGCEVLIETALSVTEKDYCRDREHCERRRLCEKKLEINNTDFIGPDCSIAALFRRALFLHDLGRFIDHHLVCTALLLCWFLVQSKTSKRHGSGYN